MITKKFCSHQLKKLENRLCIYNAFIKEKAKTNTEDPFLHFKIYKIVPQIIEAINMLRSGDYGICIECEEEIPVIRLKISPSAIRCTTCQAEREKRNAIKY